MQIIIYGIIRGFHDIATVLWIGGLVFSSFVLFPTAKKLILKEGNSDVKILVQKIMNKIKILTLISLPVLIITGILEARNSDNFNRLFSFENAYMMILSIKHILVVVMIILVILRRLIFKPRNKEQPLSKQGIIIMYINTIIGITVLILSGLTTAFGS